MDNYFISILAINVGIAVLGIFALRHIQGLTYGVNPVDELSKKDNYAFGLSFAGSVFAFSKIIAAAVSGDPASIIWMEAVNIGLYAILGLILLRLGSLVFEVLIFDRFSVKTEVLKQNLGAGIVQMANFVALGIIISSTIHWVDVETYHGLLIVVFNFCAAQVTLLIVTRIRARIYMSRHNNRRLQDAIAAGNYALAVRYSGHLIAAAIAISSVGAMIPYLSDTPWISASLWFIGGLVTTLAVTFTSAVASKIILAGIDVVEEVDIQKNYGIAAVEAMIFIAIALVIEPILLVADSLL